NLLRFRFLSHDRRLLLFLPFLRRRVWIRKRSCAVPTFLLDVVAFGKRRDLRRLAAQLSRSLQDDLRASVVLLDLSMNLNVFALKLPHIAHMLQVRSKDHDRKRAHAIVLAKIEEVHAATSWL